MPMESPRPVRLLEEFGRRYPGAWKMIDVCREFRGQLSNWPQWCFCPVAGAYSIVSAEIGQHRLETENTRDVGVLAALAAWRVTQGIYRFDPDVLEAVWNTPVDRLPTDVLYHLPEWCCYVETPGRDFGTMPVDGFFVHLEHDANDGHHELRILLDTPAFAEPVLTPIHLDQPTLRDGLLKAFGWTEAVIERGIPDQLRQKIGEIPPAIGGSDILLAPFVSVVLYLCSVGSEIRAADGSSRLPSNPAPKKVKKGVRLFPPPRPAQWDVAFRLGAALRAARLEVGDGSPREGTGSHASPRAHIRKAHWHTFLAGPRSSERVRRVKWLPPIPVNVEDSAQLIPTIHPVQ